MLCVSIKVKHKNDFWLFDLAIINKGGELL